MQKTTYCVYANAYVGYGEMKHLPKLVKQYGTRILLLHEPQLTKRRDLNTALNCILPNEAFATTKLAMYEALPSLHFVQRGAEMARDVDCIVAIGGQRIIECANIISQSPKEPIPVIGVLTIMDLSDGHKDFGVQRAAHPCISQGKNEHSIFLHDFILDYHFVAEDDNNNFVICMAEIFCAVLDSHLSNTDNYAHQQFAEAILRIIIKYGHAAVVENNSHAWQQILWACAVATSELILAPEKPESRCKGAQRLGSVLWEKLNVPFGVGYAVMLIPWLRHMLTVDTLPHYAALGQGAFGLVGNDEEIAVEMMDCIEAWFSDIGMPLLLRALDLLPDDIQLLAANAVTAFENDCEANKLSYLQAQKLFWAAY